MSVDYAAISTTQNIKIGTSIIFVIEDVDVYLANLYVKNINKFLYINDGLNGFTADIGNDEKSQAMVRANLTAGFVFEL